MSSTENQLKLHPAQAEIAADRHRFRVVNCGRRFGKTVLAIQEMIGAATHLKDANVAYIAPTYQQARDICWNQLKSLTTGIAKKVNESRLEIVVANIHGTTSIISLRGWESAETLRGQFFHFIVIDEIAQMREFWPAWRTILYPTLTDKSGECLFLSTPRGFNHFYDLFNAESKDPDFKSFHFTSYDNPFLPKKEIDKARIALPEDQFSQEYMADFRKMEGLVYKEFSRERHLLSTEALTNLENKEWKDILVGIDFGFTNPTAIITIKVDKDNNFYILDEWYKTQKTNADVINYLKLMRPRPNEVFPDKAEPDRIKEISDEGFNCVDVNKDVEYGIQLIQQLLKQNKIFVSPHCENVIHEFETYRFANKRPANNEFEKPVKENDHAMDSIKYVISTYSPYFDDEDDGEEFNLYGESFN
jgi:PBSX family phage terminase large subunit